MNKAKNILILLENKMILRPIKGKEYRYFPIETDKEHPINIVGRTIEPNSIVIVTREKSPSSELMVWVKDKYGNEMAVARASLEEI